MKIQVLVELEINTDDVEKIEEIIQEMNYNFSYIDDNQDYIIDSQILEYK